MDCYKGRIYMSDFTSGQSKFWLYMLREYLHIIFIAALKSVVTYFNVSIRIYLLGNFKDLALTVFYKSKNLFIFIFRLNIVVYIHFHGTSLPKILKQTPNSKKCLLPYQYVIVSFDLW